MLCMRGRAHELPVSADDRASTWNGSSIGEYTVSVGIFVWHRNQRNLHTDIEILAPQSTDPVTGSTRRRGCAKLRGR